MIESWYSNQAIGPTNLTEGTLDPVEGGMNVSIHLKAELFDYDKVYYIAMKAYDEKNVQSPLSNIVRVEIESDDSGLSGGAIAGIVIGSIFGGIVLVLGAYALWRKFG